MARLTVAYILTPISFGGSEKVSLNFLRTVDRSRFDIRPVLLIRPWETEPYFEQEINTLGYTCEKVPVALDPSGGPLRVPRVVWRLLSILKGTPFDLVHTHGYFADICGFLPAYFLKIKHVSTCHGFIETDKKLRTYNYLDKIILRSCRKVIAVSGEIRTELINSGISSTRIQVIPNAVKSSYDENELSVRRNEKREMLGVAPGMHVVGYLGRLSEEKGLAFLVQAIARLYVASIPVKLLIVGDGPQRASLEKLVKEKGIENEVIFTGFQTDIENWIFTFDIFALPSLTEGTPMALLEAMALGIPVVASAVGGVPKIINNLINGLLIEPEDSDSMEKAIKLLVENIELKIKIAAAGKFTVKNNYDINNWCQNIESFYDSLQKE